MSKKTVLFVPLLLLACHGQPTIAASNATTEKQLTAISANTSDGAGIGTRSTGLTPTVGQRLDAEPQPPKSQ